MLKILTSEYQNQCKDFLFKHFFQCEPISKALCLTEEEIFVFLEIVLSNAVKDGLSTIKVSSTDNIIGCIITEDYFKEIDTSFELISENFTPLFVFLDELGVPFKKKYKKEKNSFAHLLMIATSESKIATQLIEYSLNHLKQKKFSYAVLEATGEISQHISLNKFHFDEIHRINYSDFFFGNEYVFESIEEPKACVFYMKRLG